jgi:hypothetical protein
VIIPRLLFALFYVATVCTAAAQEGAVATLTTDKEVYEYGEPIELRYRVVNEGDEEFVWVGSGTCIVGFAWGGLIHPGEPGICMMWEPRHVFPPSASRTWVWILNPADHAVPEADGKQHIVAGRGIVSPSETIAYAHLPAEVNFGAPRFVGGVISVGFAAGVTYEDVADVMETLNVTVLNHRHWRIEGVTPWDAIATYGDDERFLWIEIYRPIQYYSVEYQVGIEPGGERTEAGLSAPFPNPSSSSVRLELVPPADGEALIELVDVQGRRVALLHRGVLPVDQPVTVTIAAPHLAAGTYVVRASGPGYAYSRPVTIVR